MSVVKVYCKIESSPWTLAEPVLIGLKKEEQPGDSDVFLHDVVFLIDRHGCVARSTGKVSRGKFQN